MGVKWRGGAALASHARCSHDARMDAKVKAHIWAEMAIRLDKAFGGGAETRHRLQGGYDFAQALKRAGKIAVRRIARAA